MPPTDGRTGQPRDSRLLVNWRYDHCGSATIEVIDEREKILTQGRFGTDGEGYRAMLKVGRRYPDRTWAVEGCNGIGRHLAQRLVADGEPVVDVPAKLSARARVFANLDELAIEIAQNIGIDTLAVVKVDVAHQSQLPPM